MEELKLTRGRPARPETSETGDSESQSWRRLEELGRHFSNLRTYCIEVFQGLALQSRGDLMVMGELFRLNRSSSLNSSRLSTGYSRERACVGACHAGGEFRGPGFPLRSKPSEINHAAEKDPSNLQFGNSAATITPFSSCNLPCHDTPDSPPKNFLNLTNPSRFFGNWFLFRLCGR